MKSRLFSHVLGSAVFLAPVAFCAPVAEGQLFRLPIFPAAPDARPAPDVSPQGLRAALLELNSPDPAAREKSYRYLMSLRRGDLEALKTASEQLKPLDSIVASALREIVVQVHASGHAYPRDTAGFMGIRMSREAVSDEAVVVTERMLGFVGYRVFEDGDAIMDIVESPLVRGGGFQERFIRAVAQFRPGQTLHMKVLRRGQIITVAVTLDARPIDRGGLGAMEGQIAEMLYYRRQEAHAYWDQHFAPLIRSSAATHARADR